MEIFTVEGEEIEKQKERKNVLVVDPDSVSLEAIELAERLAKNAFKNGKNIATSFPMEFALWLAGKTNISSALSELSPKGDRAIVIDFNSKRKKIPKGIRKSATWEEIERMSLSRL